MDTKHLSKGSKCPAMPKGKLRLYSMRFCPYAQRAHLVLDAKKIPHDIVFINLKEKPDWFFERNPLGKVPAIEFESGDCIYESLIIADYLDEKYKQTPLHNQDPMKKAQDRLLVERFSQVTGKMFMAIRENNPESLEALINELEIYDKELKSRGTPFLGGDKPGMIDYMIWPWFERIYALKSIHGDKFQIPKDRITKLQEWVKSMTKDDAVKVTYIAPDNHAKFMEGYLTGTPNYDLLAKA